MHEALHERRQQHKAVGIAGELPGHPDHARQRAGRLHDRQVGLPAEGILARQFNDEIQALVEHPREGVGRVQRDRRQDRAELAHEEAARPFTLCLVPGGGQVKEHPFFLQQGQNHVLQHVILHCHQLLHAFRDDLVCLLQGKAVGRDAGRIVTHLLLQAGHADLEELVQIA